MLAGQHPGASGAGVYIIMAQRHAWQLIALSGLSLVALGAFGAHALAAHLEAPALNAWESAVRYQAWHTLAAMALLIRRERRPLAGQRATLALWGAGTLLFSGSLYALTLGAPPLLGPVTPVGGALLMAGWIALLATERRARS